MLWDTSLVIFLGSLGVFQHHTPHLQVGWSSPSLCPSSNKQRSPLLIQSHLVAFYLASVMQHVAPLLPAPVTPSDVKAVQRELPRKLQQPTSMAWQCTCQSHPRNSLPVPDTCFHEPPPCVPPMAPWVPIRWQFCWSLRRWPDQAWALCRWCALETWVAFQDPLSAASQGPWRAVMFSSALAFVCLQAVTWNATVYFFN